MGSTHHPLDWSSYANVIDGRLSSTAQVRHSINPATGEDNPDVPVSTQDDVEEAMQAAKRAQVGWAAISYEDRRKALLAFADAVEAEFKAFSDMLIREQGKPRQFADFEMNIAIKWIRTMTNLDLPTHKIEEEGKTIVTRYTPLGVVVAIIPWNYPIFLATGKIAPCLVTGNTMIVKPSPFTPCGGLKLVELGQRFFPPGVLQALSGDDNLGPWLTSHPIPAKISFTGSTFTGKKVMETASKTLKRVTLELGGNDPAIVCEDVDIADVAPKIAQFAFLNTGQICLALKRVYVHERIFEDFKAAMIAATRLLKVGEGNEPGVFMGPIQNKMQYERVKGLYEHVKEEKLDISLEGDIPSGSGYFINPTIVDRPPENSRLVAEEPFGPIVPLLSYSTYEEAISRANDTHYGLGASIWSGSSERANELAQKIQAGTVWVNTHFHLDGRVPFGGHKESGIGTEWGVSGLVSYCNSQTLFLEK
ncbi:uncharacterized protein BHQ10_004989 [Talaromyces amestolkiae]|uniref:aldehyde dehydrogenase (NAD(+)) n=1 Tax=Talaromyces amestolkiae TaxID=1196081 RepID=A0A364KZJ1_TALAM|nr:uncharacterized protein BHQ10_004989 [Talaromyces amestolkiae]RAO68977.1 hypothetical protein BHQ10_004989 [Talaromyces amestolkiae]